MELIKYKKGDKIAGCYLGSFAGEDLQVASAYNIHADIFNKGKYYQCPNVVSLKKGSGKFLDFLKLLKKTLDKPIFFCTITNEGIYKYLKKAGIGIVVYKDDKPLFYDIKIEKK